MKKTRLKHICVEHAPQVGGTNTDNEIAVDLEVSLNFMPSSYGILSLAIHVQATISYTNDEATADRSEAQ